MRTPLPPVFIAWIQYCSVCALRFCSYLIFSAITKVLDCSGTLNVFADTFAHLSSQWAQWAEGMETTKRRRVGFIHLHAFTTL